MLTYFRIFCGNLIGGEIYMTRDEAQAAADARTAMSGRVWEVREIRGRVVVWYH